MIDKKRYGEVAEFLKALGHPTRLQIVDELTSGPKCVTDIENLLPVSQVNVSQHLTVLRHAGIVDFVQNGSLRCYYLALPDLVPEVFEAFRRELKPVKRSKEDVIRERMAAGKRPHAK